MYRILHIILLFLGSMSKRKECMKMLGGENDEQKKWLYRIGIFLFSIGLILANVYSDIPPLFPSLLKGLV